MSTSCRPFVGIGTGRCGTHSLCEILKACGVRAKHEGYSVPWYEPNERLGQIIKHLREDRIHGNVACYILPHVGQLRAAIPDLRVVYLWRPKEQLVKSWMNVGQHVFRPADKMQWLDRSYADRAQSSRCFPLIDAASRRQAVEFYWEMYDEMARSISDPFFELTTDQLNDDVVLNRLCDFLGVETRNFPDKRHYSTATEVDKAKQEMARGRLGVS